MLLPWTIIAAFLQLLLAPVDCHIEQQ